MIENVLVAGVLLTYCFNIVRTIFILMGWFKSAALRTFEQYGVERPFRPFSDLVFYIVILLILVRMNVLPQYLSNLRFIAFFLGGAMMLGGMYTFQDVLAAIISKISPKYGELYKQLTWYFPEWYRDLATRTSRYERRRIAYMWLRLSPHQRFLLDRDTQTFMHWTDFVIMGSVMEEDLDAKPIPKTHERSYFN
jgi:hypothetical protein